MSITDELREYACTRISPNRGMLRAIADRIDAEHERAVRYERCAFWHDASDDELAHYGLLRGPIDADGVIWRIGDRDEDGNTVMAIKLATDGFWIIVGCIYRQAYEAHQYHEPTIEDVLRELVGKAQVLSCVDDEDELVTEYAKRLTLAEGEDE